MLSYRLSALAATVKQRSMLVLGGTGGLGPQVVVAALAEGYDVTLFNRGITNPQLFPQLRKLRGFRNVDRSKENLSALQKGTWDVVIDVWPSEPSMVASAAELLHGRTEHYVYISSIAAYDILDYADAGTTETSPVRRWNGDETDYGRSKAESERRLNGIVRGKLTILRPGAIEATPPGWCGPGGGLLLTWLSRCMDGRRHIGPGDGSDPIQYIDAKGIADFALQSIAGNHLGTYNIVRDSVPLREHIEMCRRATGSIAEFVWIPRSFLLDHALYPASYIGDGKPQYFTGWIADPAIRGLYQISNEKLKNIGWRARPFGSVVAEALAACPVMAVGRFSVPETLEPEKEAAVLDAWDCVQKAKG